jgi:hypothetical protein
VGPRPRPFRALRRRPPREASWGVGVAQVRPGCVPASVPPSPARPTMKGRGVPGGVCPAAHVVHPAAPAGRLSAGWRSETWPGGFARAGQSRQPGTDRPGSSARALLPRPRVTPGGGHLRDPPTSASAVGIPVPRGLPARRQGGHRAAAPAPDFRVPWVRPSPTAPSPRVTGQPWRVLRSQGLARGARLGASAPSRTWR